MLDTQLQSSGLATHLPSEGNDTPAVVGQQKGRSQGQAMLFFNASVQLIRSTLRSQRPSTARCTHRGVRQGAAGGARLAATRNDAVGQHWAHRRSAQR
jgi:hypothetical protein